MVVNCVVSVCCDFPLRLFLASGHSNQNTLLMYILGFLLNAGRVVRADIMTESSGRSKGCGTVLFETSEDAAHAISILLTCKCGLLQCLLLQKIFIPLQMKGVLFFS